MIKTNLYPWQIILIHMQEDLTVMKEKFLVVEITNCNWHDKNLLANYNSTEGEDL